MAAARVRLWAIAVRASQALSALNRPEGRCASGPSMSSAKTCSMTAWPRWCASACTSTKRFGERAVVAPHGEQFALRVNGALVEIRDAPHDQPCGDVVAGAFERGVGDLGDLGAGDEALLLVVQDRLRVLDLDPRIVRDRRDRPGG